MLSKTAHPSNRFPSTKKLSFMTMLSKIAIATVKGVKATVIEHIRALLSDLESGKDALKRDKAARAIARLLASTDLDAPFVLGILGP